MKTEERGYVGVRYALQPRESKVVKKLIRKAGGLTHDEIRTLASELGVASKPIQNALNELKLPILSKRSDPIPANLFPSGRRAKSEAPAAPEPVPEPSTNLTEAQVIALQRENAKLRTEIAEHRQIRAKADADLLKARKILLETAARRRRHQEEQAALEDPRKQVEELTDALRICRQVLDSLSGRYSVVVTRLPLPQLHDLIKKAKAELKRRETGGRRRQWP